MLKHIYLEKHLALTVGLKNPLTKKFHIHVSYEQVFIVSQLFPHHIQMSSIKSLSTSANTHAFYLLQSRNRVIVAMHWNICSHRVFIFHDGPIVRASCANGETEP